jgi:hypothetical protein
VVAELVQAVLQQVQRLQLTLVAAAAAVDLVRLQVCIMAVVMVAQEWSSSVILAHSVEQAER